MKSTLIFSIFMLLVSMSCKNTDSEKNEEAALPTDTPEETQANPDSIQQLYAAKLAAREKTWPLEQVLEVGKLNPVDEAPLDTSFFLFREGLLSFIENRDIFSLIQHVDEDIKCSFGAENGVPGFIKIWGLDTPAKTQTSELWPTLKKVLAQWRNL